MKNKVALISINSPYELTGGGHYLRSLIDGYSENSSELTVIAKKTDRISFKQRGFVEVLYEKTLKADIISRLFLSINFLFYYIIRIDKIVKSKDIISFHSSRLGFMAFIFKCRYPKKKIFLHFDNVEYKLLKDKVRNVSLSLKYLITFFDFCFSYLTEKVAVKCSDTVTFITDHDASFFDIKSYEVIPICFPKKNLKDSTFDLNPSNSYVLFTGSFDFDPNKYALKEYSLIANNNQNINFIAAGRGLSKFKNMESNNLKLIDSPSNDAMAELFNRASVYLSTVRLGSGMKTKIAEAMSYGLSVISTHHSLIGYEVIKDSSYIEVYDDANSLKVDLSEDLLSRNKKGQIISDFNKHFSYEKVSDVLKWILK
jgi:glycosyltransferase involved in cell wall biosynthesis